MYLPPTGPDLTAEQAQELEDTFLASDPFEYFRSRIAASLAWDEWAPTDDDGADPFEAPDDPTTLRSQFNSYLQRPAVNRSFRAVDIHAQIAADAFSLRHHAAEALVRLAVALFDPATLGAEHSVWAEIADGPKQTEDLLGILRAVSAKSDAGDRLWFLVMAAQRDESIAEADLVSAANVFGSWLSYSANLLTGGDPIDLYGAHNKVKHGLAVRARADLKETFLLVAPDDDGNVPESAFQGDGAIDIFDCPVLEFLAHPPKVDGHGQGLELTQLRLNAAALLAESFMIAWTHAAMFHVAAAKHFDGRPDLPGYLKPPPFPGLPIDGPYPKHIDAHSLLGIRFPITGPPGGGAPARGTGIGFRDRFIPLHVDYDKRTTGRVVDG